MGATKLGRMKRSASLCVLLTIVAMAVSGVTPGKAAASPSEMFYSVSAHSDDEIAGWGMIEQQQDKYIVLILLTLGEQTTSCMTPEESVAPAGVGVDDAVLVEGFMPSDPLGLGEHPDGDRYHGPYKYQGPDSPVGQPDKGERHPFGFPWQGQGSQACKDARVASWLWFQDDMAGIDGSVPDMQIGDDPFIDDDYQGEFCTQIGCVSVWANELGARVTFDLGDGDLTTGEVVAAVQEVRANRAEWGIAILPESGIFANVMHAEAEEGYCRPDAHPDHIAVQDALYGTDFGAGPQYGKACALSKRYRESTGPVAPIDPVALIEANYVDPVTERRIGAYQVNYGWLFETYYFAGPPDPTFWRRFG